jgi:uncharacterized membrane protein
MFLFWLSAVLVVGANVAYHLTQKAIPGEVNPLASVIVTFLSATLASTALLPAFAGRVSLLGEFAKVNWTSVALGFAIVGVDVGYLLLYRSGWFVSYGAVFCNSLVALLLLPIGVLFYRERVVFSNCAGVLLVIVGVLLIVRR